MRLNAIQFLTNSSVMMSMMFIPLLADEMGASLTQVGIIMSVFGTCLFVSSYLFSKAADALDIRQLLLFGLACSTLAYFLQVFAYDPLSLAVIRGVLGISVGMYPAALIMHVYGLKRSMGKFISFGALGWAAGFFLAGLIGDFALIFITSSLMVLVSFVIATGIPKAEIERINVDYFSLSTVRKNGNVYLTFFLRHIGAVACWTIFPLYLSMLGANKFWIGVIFTINPMVQFFLMRRMDGLNMDKIVKIGYLLSAAAFFSLVPATVFFHVIPSMLLVAASWSFLLVGSTELLLQRNRDKATASGFLNSVISLSMIVGALLGGTISNQWGFDAVFVIAGCLSLVSLLIVSLPPGSADRADQGEQSFNNVDHI